MYSTNTGMCVVCCWVCVGFRGVAGARWTLQEVGTATLTDPAEYEGGVEKKEEWFLCLSLSSSLLMKA